jgi:hypothetical protein
MNPHLPTHFVKVLSYYGQSVLVLLLDNIYGIFNKRSSF